MNLTGTKMRMKNSLFFAYFAVLGVLNAHAAPIATGNNVAIGAVAGA